MMVIIITVTCHICPSQPRFTSSEFQNNLRSKILLQVYGVLTVLHRVQILNYVDVLLKKTEMAFLHDSFDITFRLIDKYIMQNLLKIPPKLDKDFIVTIPCRNIVPGKI